MRLISRARGLLGISLLVSGCVFNPPFPRNAVWNPFVARTPCDPPIIMEPFDSDVTDMIDVPADQARYEARERVKQAARCARWKEQHPDDRTEAEIRADMTAIERLPGWTP